MGGIRIARRRMRVREVRSIIVGTFVRLNPNGRKNARSFRTNPNRIVSTLMTCAKLCLNEIPVC